MNRTEHLLVILMEECSEVAHRASKALRFGLTETQQDHELDNSERLIVEINDLLGVVMMLTNDGSLPAEQALDLAAQCAKMQKVEKFLNYSRKCGTLKEPKSAAEWLEDARVRCTVDDRWFQFLWTQAVGLPGYDKAQWKALRDSFSTGGSR